jgi:hypothetical protein
MKRPKRPRDPNQLGKLIVDLATGERTEDKNVPDPSARRLKTTPMRWRFIHVLQLLPHPLILANVASDASWRERNVGCGRSGADD